MEIILLHTQPSPHLANPKTLPSFPTHSAHSSMKSHSETEKQINTEIKSLVEKVIEDVRINKDTAIIKYTKKFDNIDLRKLGIFFQPNEIEESIGKIDLLDRKAIELSIGRITDFHKSKCLEI